jgi:hypothetical protein
MATFGSLQDVPYAAVDALAPIPQGHLEDPYVYSAVEAIVPPPLTSRFPTPPSAYGFLKDGFFEVLPGRIGSTEFYMLHPEGTRLEPTQGQIWPR